MRPRNCRLRSLAPAQDAPKRRIRTTMQRDRAWPGAANSVPAEAFLSDFASAEI